MKLKTILQQLFRNDRATTDKPSERFKFYDVGFHGDKNLLDIIDAIAPTCRYFIETGTNVGSSLAYVARKFPHLQCYSCEPDLEAFEHAVRNVQEMTNVQVFNHSSQEFIAHLENEHQTAFGQTTMFWLDAHGYGFKWPLREEVAFITSHFRSVYILIDDFQVPGLDVFGYDEYQGQKCTFDYIKNYIDQNVAYHLYYPAYSERTSQHHPLRGWGMIVYGNPDGLILPSHLSNKVRESHHE